MNIIPIALAANNDTETSGLIPDFLTNIILGGVAFVATFFLATFLRIWVKKLIRKKQGDQHKEMQILYGRIIFSSTFVIGGMIALTVMGAPLEWFTGGLGLGIAFALREILANFFAGMMLLSNNKFNLGDFISLDPDTAGKSAICGTIVDIQSRATSLRSFDGGEFTVPNIKMLGSSVKCFKNPIRRHAIAVGVGYGTNIKKACELIKKTVSANEVVQPEPAPLVIVKEIADSAIILEVRFWTESQSAWLIAKSDLTRDIFNVLNEAKIDIPYPVQTLRVDEYSSDILAKQPHLLENLENIEKAKMTKQTTPEKNPITPAPTTTPTPTITPTPTPTPTPTITTPIK